MAEVGVPGPVHVLCLDDASVENNLETFVADVTYVYRNLTGWVT